MTLQGKPPLAPGGTEVRADLGRASCWARGGGGVGTAESWGRRAREAEARVGMPAFCQRGAAVRHRRRMCPEDSWPRLPQASLADSTGTA